MCIMFRRVGWVERNQKSSSDTPTSRKLDAPSDSIKERVKPNFIPPTSPENSEAKRWVSLGFLSR